MRNLQANSISEPGPFWSMFCEDGNEDEVITLTTIPLYSPGRARATLETALSVWGSVPTSPYLLTPSRQWLIQVVSHTSSSSARSSVSSFCSASSLSEEAASCDESDTEACVEQLYLAAAFPYTNRTMEDLCQVCV